MSYIIKDLDATEKEVQKATIKADGSLGQVEKKLNGRTRKRDDENQLTKKGVY